MASAAGFKIVVDDVADAVRDFITNMDKPVREACKAAIDIAGTNLIDKGQEDIARAGFSARWQNTWKARYYPEDGRASINAAVYAHHIIPYADIFEEGGTITGHPLLWIPLHGAPTNFGKGHITPKKLIESGIRLFTINRAGKAPLLATKLYESATKAKKLNFNVTAASLRKSRRKPKNANSKQVLVTVPLFFGVQSVTIKKKWHLDKIAQAERDALPSYYVQSLKAD